MRRKISLYIAGQAVDLDNESIILFNYTQEDLSSPTIVKNAYSKQITIKGTDANNKLFGNIYKLDRQTIPSASVQSGVNFDPLRKTPFSIYRDNGEILESGYAKLDKVNIQGGAITYTVTLYGGLGSFFYALSYKDDGDKLTLADLDYLGGEAPDDELTFQINATNVQAAWSALANAQYSGKWKVINFAPCYNGIPDNGFSANKGLFVPSSAGMADSITDEGVTYTLKSGYALATLAEAVTEWAAKDLRSYLQRPLFSLKAFLSAICNPSNNGGYTVDISSLSGVQNYFEDLWMTLPLLPCLGTYKQTSGTASVVRSGGWSTNKEMARYTLDGVGSVPSGTIFNTTLNVALRQRVTQTAASNPVLYNQQYHAEDAYTTTYKRSVAFVQAVAYDSLNQKVGGSKVQCIGHIGANVSTIREAASKFGFVPEYADDSVWGGVVTDGMWMQENGGIYKFSRDMSLQVSAANVIYYKVFMTEYHYDATMQRVQGQIYWYESNIAGGGNGRMQLYFPENVLNESVLTGYVSEYADVVNGTAAHQITYGSGDKLRSNAIITKQMLLSSSETPAQVLLSFCKMFGLYIRYDNASKKVSILTRSGLYDNETIDLTQRIDRSKGISINPLLTETKWLNFKAESVGGEFSDEYERVQGTAYGSKRVNTGYEYNADTKDATDGVIFKQAVPSLEYDKYYCTLTKDSKFYPSPFLDMGAKYTLWSAGGDSKDIDISGVPADATVTYYNAQREGYDIEGAVKLQMHDSSGKGIDGANVLCVLNRFETYADFKLTDDLIQMDAVNEGTPCWILGRGNGVSVPLFSRYKVSNGVMVNNLDFGVPAEANIPEVTYYDEGLTVYERSWRKYLEDRYSRDTEVMTCMVNFDGIEVSQALLRKFYFYGGSVWVLNRISNYSLTTYDPVECEFIRVGNKTNYTNGQTI